MKGGSLKQRGDETPAAEGILGESMQETPQPVIDGAEDRRAASVFPVEARSVGDDVQLLVDRRGVGHLVEPVPQAAGEVEPDVAAQQAGIDGEPGFPLAPSTCS